MAITEAYAGSATISTTEISVVSGTSTLQSITTAGVYQLFLDLSTMVAGDSFRLRVKEKTQSSSTQRVAVDVTLSGAQTEPVYITASMVLMNGWDMTLLRVGGTNRSIEWSIRKVA